MGGQWARMTTVRVGRMIEEMIMVMEMKVWRKTLPAVTVTRHAAMI